MIPNAMLPIKEMKKVHRTYNPGGLPFIRLHTNHTFIQKMDRILNSAIHNKNSTIKQNKCQEDRAELGNSRPLFFRY